MERHFWLEVWKENNIRFHQQQINRWLDRYFDKLLTQEDDLVFVPLCGKSRDMLWIASLGRRVLGVELSPIAVESFFEENGLEATVEEGGSLRRLRSGPIEIVEGDFFDLRPEDLSGVSAIYDRAALVALPPDIRRRYATRMGELVPARTRMLLLSFEYAEGVRQGPPFAIEEPEVRELFEEAFEVERLETDVNGAGDLTVVAYVLERRPEKR